MIEYYPFSLVKFNQTLITFRISMISFNFYIYIFFWPDLTSILDINVRIEVWTLLIKILKITL